MASFQGDPTELHPACRYLHMHVHIWTDALRSLREGCRGQAQASARLGAQGSARKEPSRLLSPRQLPVLAAWTRFGRTMVLLFQQFTKIAKQGMTPIRRLSRMLSTTRGLPQVPWRSRCIMMMQPLHATHHPVTAVASPTLRPENVTLKHA